ncbi:hypothetical protein ANANG_G00253790 [Anguilla anguilla]|uniref:Uncharacterized protein n=1 Tax=Anguilla anguilla TaxID=7936 RepID=A0A9D3M0V9_ANGAN|nr:hypothetical protein ANANG_G00253790 [Anguilla anguilla]
MRLALSPRHGTLLNCGRDTDECLKYVAPVALLSSLDSPTLSRFLSLPPSVSLLSSLNLSEFFPSPQGAGVAAFVAPCSRLSGTGSLQNQRGCRGNRTVYAAQTVRSCSAKEPYIFGKRSSVNGNCSFTDLHLESTRSASYTATNSLKGLQTAKPAWSGAGGRPVTWAFGLQPIGARSTSRGQ